MGLCGSQEKLSKEDKAARDAEKAISKELEKKLRDESLQDNQVNKLLLLGAGESGKSTLFKQMITLYRSGFSDDEKKWYTQIVYNNTITCMKVLCQQCDEYNQSGQEGAVSCVAEEEKKFITELNTDVDITMDVANKIKTLWADPGIQWTYEQRANFQLLDSAEYFFKRLDIIGADDYLPDEQDVLCSRVRTTGIVENNFKIQDSEFKMFDVGGQRNERKKWIHCFENVTAVIFVAAISEYDQKLYEDETMNRIHESLNLFEEIVNLEWFEKTSMILFLNKRDLFEKKIQKVSLTVCFGEDYDTSKYADLDYEAGCQYLQMQFEDRNRNPQGHSIYTHFTTATDKGNVSHVFDAVKDIVIRASLDQAGLV